MTGLKQIPKDIKNEIETALAYFPQLQEVEIQFKFKKRIRKSTMQAQPSFRSLFRKKQARSYTISISEQVEISGKQFQTKQLPSEIFIGWIGHELGHVMDYQERSTLNLIQFGINYVLFDRHKIEAERMADSYAVAQGMEAYILKTKEFILNHAGINPSYKSRIIKYYLSPEEIMELVQRRDLTEDLH